VKSLENLTSVACVPKTLLDIFWHTVYIVELFSCLHDLKFIVKFGIVQAPGTPLHSATPVARHLTCIRVFFIYGNFKLVSYRPTCVSQHNNTTENL